MNQNLLSTMRVLYLELQKLAAPTGHEPAPSSVTGKCSTLSYGTMNHIAEAKKGLEPSTHQTLLQLLYLIELQSHSTMQKFAIHRYQPAIACVLVVAAQRRPELYS